MNSLGEVFRRSGPAYRARWGSQLAAAQRAAMHASAAGRTEALGGQRSRCPDCQTSRYASHACRNRHGPTCQPDAAQAGLARQQALLLPVPSVLVPFTRPGALRAVAFEHPALVYELRFRASAAALQQLAQEPRFVGGQIGMLGVLQTWTRDRREHPHLHSRVPGGGLAADGRSWTTARADVRVHVKPLAARFRARLRAALRQTARWASIPAEVWRQDGVVDGRPVGSGRTALTELAPSVFRVALRNTRRLAMADGQVSLRSQDGETGQSRPGTLPAEAFIARFLRHILPKGGVSVRSDGLLRVGARQQLARLRGQLVLQQRTYELLAAVEARAEPAMRLGPVCPGCGQEMRLERVLPPQRGPPGPPLVA